MGVDSTPALAAVGTGSRVVIEEPHYSGFAFCLRAAGAELVPIAVDVQGLTTDALAAVRDARLA
jgi:GntR family transcriptional regulator/MocR family aminotransferase